MMREAGFVLSHRRPRLDQQSPARARRVEYVAWSTTSGYTNPSATGHPARSTSALVIGLPDRALPRTALAALGLPAGQPVVAHQQREAHEVFLEVVE